MKASSLGLFVTVTLFFDYAPVVPLENCQTRTGITEAISDTAAFIPPDFDVLIEEGIDVELDSGYRTDTDVRVHSSKPGVGLNTKSCNENLLRRKSDKWVLSIPSTDLPKDGVQYTWMVGDVELGKTRINILDLSVPMTIAVGRNTSVVFKLNHPNAKDIILKRALPLESDDVVLFFFESKNGRAEGCYYYNRDGEVLPSYKFDILAITLLYKTSVEDQYQLTVSQSNDVDAESTPFQLNSGELQSPAMRCPVAMKGSTMSETVEENTKSISGIPKVTESTISIRDTTNFIPSESGDSTTISVTSKVERNDIALQKEVSKVDDLTDSRTFTTTTTTTTVNPSSTFSKTSLSVGIAIEYVIVIVVCLSVVILVLIAFLTIVFRKNTVGRYTVYRAGETHSMYAINNHITQRAENADMNSNRVAYSPISEHSVIDISINTNNQTTEDSLLVHDEWEFPREKLYFFGLSLGQGEFGEVKRADAVNIRGHPGSTEVAVKTLHANSSKEDKRNFLRELLLMKSFSTGHPNVVSLLGCCTESEPILIIVELAKHGSLQNYLRKVREDYTYANLDEECQSIPTKDLLQFAWQIAKGMSFLTTNGCVHRDLATRNILLGENRTCKISDFGLARDVTSEMIYRRKSEDRLPIRWMAPESLRDSVHTTRSDVWSYGIVLWEIITLGSTPYISMTTKEVVNKILRGFRMPKPRHCNNCIYEVMLKCWQAASDERPTFSELCTKIGEIANDREKEYLAMREFEHHIYVNLTESQWPSGEKI